MASVTSTFCALSYSGEVALLNSPIGWYAALPLPVKNKEILLKRSRYVYRLDHKVELSTVARTHQKTSADDITLGWNLIGLFCLGSSKAILVD